MRMSFMSAGVGDEVTFAVGQKQNMEIPELWYKLSEADEGPVDGDKIKVMVLFTFLTVPTTCSYPSNVKRSRVRVHHGASIDFVPSSPCWSCLGRHALSG